MWQVGMTKPSLLGLIAVSMITSLSFAQHAPRDVQFEHLPLRYTGPDPTSGYFLPAASQLLSGGYDLTQVPPSEAAPELLVRPQGSADFFPSQQEAWMYAAPGMGPHVTDHKDGFFQKLGLTGTYIDRGSSTGFGINELNFLASVAVPMPTREWPMLITPTFTVRYLDGPLSPDLPPRLYEGYVDFLWVPRLSDRWTGIVGVAPSYYGDFKVEADDAFRWTGKALARYDWVPERVQLIFGALYLNRDDIRVLPAGGVIWTPSHGRRYELLFPRPKLAHRIDHGPNYEDWVYLGGEFGGNTFVVERLGVPESITLRDFRALLGLERKLNGGAGYRIEIGYVMGRKIEFASGIPDAEADDTALVRGGVSY
jgi:hypothetical protein